MSSAANLVPRPRLRVALPLLIVASGLSVAMIVFRVQATDQQSYRLLIGNLCFAWVLFLLAGVTAALARSRWSVWLCVIFGGLWLLVLPNAPYLVTSIIRLGRLATDLPQWFDLTRIGLVVATGLGLGYLSLAINRASGPNAGWLTRRAAAGQG